MKDIKKISYKMVIILMIIVTFLTHIIGNISYATNNTTTDTSSQTTNKNINKEKKEEIGDLAPEKNPMNNKVDRPNIGKSEIQDQTKNADAELKQGSKNRGFGQDLSTGALNVLLVVLLGVACLPIIYGAVIVSVIAALNINPKYIEAYEKGESKRKEKEEKSGEKVEDDTVFQNFIAKYMFTLDKLFFGDIKALDVNIFNLDNNKENNSRGNNANLNLKKGVAVWTNATKGFAVGISLLLFILGAIMLMINSASSNPRADAIAMLKNFLTDTVKGLLIAMLITLLLAVILAFHDIALGIFNTVRYKMLESGSQSVEILIYKQLLGDKITSGYGYTITFVSFLFMAAYHIKFFMIFINRLLTIGFLIVVSPVISVTYAIDKIGDGKSQVLTNFFKEFNDSVLVGLIYPLLYLVYMYALSPIVAVSPLLALFVITQFSRAEKTIKGMLNLRKLTTIRSSDAKLDFRMK